VNEPEQSREVGPASLQQLLLLLEVARGASCGCTGGSLPHLRLGLGLESSVLLLPLLCQQGLCLQRLRGKASALLLSSSSSSSSEGGEGGHGGGGAGEGEGGWR